MKNYLKSISADSLTGTILAVEGILDASVILNGPTGCKFYHSAIADQHFVQNLFYDPTIYNEEFFFGQPKVPCTYLDSEDYIYGSEEKLTKLINSEALKNRKLIVVVNSPGAALIGDDLQRFLDNHVKDKYCLAIEITGYSGTFSEGFNSTVIQIIKLLKNSEKPVVRKKSVNIIGANIFTRYCEGDLNEIKRIFNLCGVEVNCCISAGATVEEFKSFQSAELNVVLYPDTGLEIAQYLKNEYDMPFISFDTLPIGFDQAFEFFNSVLEILEADNSSLVEEFERARASAYIKIARFNSLTGLPAGASFGVKADSYTTYSVVRFLTSYLSMIPLCVETTDNNEFTQKINALLKHLNLNNKQTEIEKCNIVLADGNTIVLNNNRGIEIALPTLGEIDITPKPFLGINGTIRLLEKILNELRKD